MLACVRAVEHKVRRGAVTTCWRPNCGACEGGPLTGRTEGLGWDQERSFRRHAFVPLMLFEGDLQLVKDCRALYLRQQLCRTTAGALEQRPYEHRVPGARAGVQSGPEQAAVV